MGWGLLGTERGSRVTFGAEKVEEGQEEAFQSFVDKVVRRRGWSSHG